MVEIRVGNAAQELLTQRLSCSQGIHAVSQDMEEKLQQLTWHHDPELLGVPMRHEGEQRQEQGVCRQASQLALGSLSPPSLISVPQMISGTFHCGHHFSKDNVHLE